jgi:DivIVA domain-containing protein
VTGSRPVGERFRRRKFGHGYSTREVDAFMDRIEAGLVTSTEVDKVQFRTVISGGYDEHEVDEALDEVISRLRATEPAGAQAPTSRLRWGRFFRSTGG